MSVTVESHLLPTYPDTKIRFVEGDGMSLTGTDGRRYLDFAAGIAVVSLSYNGTPVLVSGAPQHVEPNVDGAVCTIDLDLGLGTGSAGYLTSDLSYDYVRINAEYRS